MKGGPLLSRFPASLAASLLFVAVAAAPGQTPTAGVSTAIVRLDAVVTDASGKPVGNLTREDFEVLEDGKPQSITNFMLVGSSHAASSRPTPEETTSSDLRGEPDSERTRYVFIVVDDLHLAREAVDPAKQALRRFVADQVAPEDQVGLVTTSSPLSMQSLTQDRAAIRQAITRIGSRDVGSAAAANGSQMTPAQAELILGGDQSALRLATRLLMDEPASVLAGSSPRAAVEAADGTTPAGLEPGEKAAARQAQREASAVLAAALRFSEITLRTVDGVLRGLAPLQGRKLCLLVSDGFLVGRGTSEELTRTLRQVTDAATRSGAVAYTLDVRGLGQAGVDAGVGGPVSDPGLRERVSKRAREESLETLRRLADDTGGLLLSGTNDPGVGLDRMLADNDAFYLIAYEPANPKRDGRYRKIELRVPRHPDFTVRTRRGYFAPDGRKPDAKGPLRANTGLPPLVASTSGLDESAIRTALATPLPATGRVRMTADYLDLPPEGSQTIVQARVDVAGLDAQAVEGRHRTHVEVLGGVYDAGGNPVGLPFGRSFDLDQGSADFGRAKEDGLRYAHRLALNPGRYEVRLIARESALTPLGGATQWLEIPDLELKKLTLSSLFVSSSPRRTAGAPLRAGEGAEGLREAQVLRRFKQSDSLYFQVYVYNIRPDEKGATDVVLQAQIRSEAKPIAASKPQAVKFQEKDGVPVPESNGMSLESLAPGNYELRVVVVDRKANATAFRSVDITVE